MVKHYLINPLQLVAHLYSILHCLTPDDFIRRKSELYKVDKDCPVLYISQQQTIILAFQEVLSDEREKAQQTVVDLKEKHELHVNELSTKHSGEVEVVYSLRITYAHAYVSLICGS